MATVLPLRREVPFGIVSAAPTAAGELADLCTELQKISSEPVTPLVVRTFPELEAGVRAGAIGVAWMPPITAVEMEIAGRGTLALSVWRGGGDGYLTAIFTRAASPIVRLEDLRGKRMAWVDPHSAAGYIFPRLKLASLGLRAEMLFAEQTFYRTHEEVARAVLDGRADVGATCLAYYPGTTKVQSAGWTKGAAYAEDAVRILATAGPIPPDAIVMASALDPFRQKRLADALMRVSVSQGSRGIVTRLFSGEGFVRPAHGQYDAVRKLVEGTGRSAAK
jgi:phosphate/phosphite/phosphonate ABC transporter binding protein